MDVATAAEIKVSEVVSAETVIERLIELKSARSTSVLATGDSSTRQEGPSANSRSMNDSRVVRCPTRALGQELIIGGRAR